MRSRTVLEGLWDRLTAPLVDLGQEVRELKLEVCPSEPSREPAEYLRAVGDPARQAHELHRKY